MKGLMLAVILALTGHAAAPPPPPPPPCSSNSATGNQMGIVQPCSPNVVAVNQIATPALVGVGITDTNATVPAGQQQIVVKAPGSLNVEVWTHGAMAVRLTQGSGGMFTGVLNLSSEPAGPLHVVYHAYDNAAGVGSPTIHLQGEYTLFVAGTRPAIPTPPPASGLTLAFSDHFTSLSSTPCKPGTGIWPNCTDPTASDGFTWYEGLFTHLDFGDCANEHTDSVNGYNPFTILPMGGLRIRNTFDPAYVDPYGFGRKQRCGILGMGFTDRSATVALTDGYYDARILIPNAFCNATGNNTCSGGTWPSFWMLELSNGANGGMEMDMTEMFGNDNHYHQAFTHAYSPAFYPASPNGGYSGYPLGSGVDLTWDWHTVGMLISNSGTAGGTVCEYFDEVQLKCDSFPQYSAPNSGVKPLWAPFVELASGGGWVSNPPPSNQYDLFIDWVGVWH